MGVVYRARDPRLDRDVAIKVLPPTFASDPDRIRRFEQEARAVGRLNHPHVLAIHDVGRVPEGWPAAGAPFLVSELLEGRTLREEMSGRALPWRTALTYAREIASGLAAAHDKGVVHRDVKPENLFVTRDGHIKILDFGLAKLRPDAEAETADRPPTPPGRASSWGRRPTCRRNRCADRTPIIARTSSRSARSCTRCSLAAARLRAPPVRRRWARSCTSIRRR